MRETLYNIGSKLARLMVWIFLWYKRKSAASWHQELQRIPKRNRLAYLIQCAITSGLLIYAIFAPTFSDDFMLGLNFAWSAFLAISFGYVLRHPMMLALVYIGVMLKDVPIEFLSSAKTASDHGDAIGAIVLFLFGIYLIIWVNSIKDGSILKQSGVRGYSKR